MPPGGEQPFVDFAEATKEAEAGAELRQLNVKAFNCFGAK